MAYRHQWYIKKHIVLSRFSETLTEDELRASINEVYDYLNQAEDAPIHVISDVSLLTSTLPLRVIMRVIWERPPHPLRGWSITVGQRNPLSRVVSEVARRVMKTNRRDFNNLEEALEFLKHTDPLIDWSKIEADVQK